MDVDTDDDDDEDVDVKVKSKSKSRRGKRPRSRGRSQSNSTDRPNTNLNASVPLSGFDPTVDFGNVSIGVSNITRNFIKSRRLEGPSYMFVRVDPFYGFINGWTNTPFGIDSDDSSQILDLTASPTADLYPATLHNTEWVRQVWPVLQNLFEIGTGSRYGISQAQFLRHQAMLLSAYINVYQVLVCNYLVYRFDWTTVSPFTSAVPLYLYEWADNIGANDPEIAIMWLRFMKRIEAKVLMPDLIRETKRMLSPFLTSDMESRLCIPYSQFAPDEKASKDARSVAVGALLNYVDNSLHKPEAVITSFLPFPVGAADPWAVGENGLLDPNRETGIWNSGHKLRSSFGDTGTTPNANYDLVAINDTNADVQKANDIFSFASRTPLPIWDQIRMSTLYWVSSNATDDYWRLVTMHRTSYRQTIDDTGVGLYYNSTDSDDDEDHKRYRRFAITKFTSGIAHGTVEPGMMHGSIAFDGVLRMMHLDVERYWAAQILRAVTINSAGSSLKELRTTIAALIRSRMS